MPKGLALTFVFIIALVLNVVAPSLFGVHAHGALPVFLAAMLLYFGISEFSIILGLIFSFLGEVMLGRPMGVVMLPFLAMVISLFFIQRLVNSKPLAFDDGGIGSGVLAVIVGLFLSIVSLVTTSIAQYFFAGEAFAIKDLAQSYYILGYYSAALVIFLILLRLLSHRRKPI